MRERSGSIIYLVGRKRKVKKVDIGFMTVMMTIQIPFLGSMWILSGYIILGKMFKKFKVWT